ncbi:hypothetical protein MMC20_005950 [Loxospora ochrophaea]|nr:hypothetical protein [Loxospora ochrophaea]
MPSSPRTPRRRPSSGLDLSITPSSPQSNGHGLNRSPHSRKSSIQSIQSATTPRPVSSHDRSGGIGFANDFGDASGLGNALGSLADELAEAWDEEGDDGERTHMEPKDETGEPNPTDLNRPQVDYDDDLGIGIAIPYQPPTTTANTTANLPISQSPPLPPQKHRRKPSRYDGSDYGSDSDFEESGMTPSLESRLSAIDQLTRIGTSSATSDASTVIQRVTDSLRDLGSQSTVESSATRLSTAHTALTTHLTYQTRLLTSLTHPLLSPLSVPPSPDLVASLAPLLTSTLLALPTPSSTALSAIHALHSSTTDLLSTLSYLSDTLHMTRQTTTLASRRLRAAREVVAELKREVEEREEGVRWVEKGGWDARLKGRECAGVCEGVVGGFEEVCKGWRERLVAEAAAAG